MTDDSKPVSPSISASTASFRQRYDATEQRRLALLDRLNKLGAHGRAHPSFRKAMTLLTRTFRDAKLVQRAAILQAADWLILIACGVAGFAAGRLLRLTGGAMIMAMLFSAAVHATGMTQVLPPYWLVACVQVAIGAVAGARFAGIRWLELRSTVLQALIWALVLLATAVAAAEVGALLFARPFAALMLALAPGGMAEMMIISYALGIETAFVVTCQLCRSFMVVTFAPMFFRLFRIQPVAPAAQAVPAQGRPKLSGRDDPGPG